MIHKFDLQFLKLSMRILSYIDLLFYLFSSAESGVLLRVRLMQFCRRDPLKLEGGSLFSCSCVGSTKSIMVKASRACKLILRIAIHIYLRRATVSDSMIALLLFYPPATMK